MKQMTSLLEKGASPEDLAELSRRNLSFEITSNHCTLVQDYVNLVAAVASRIPEEYQRPIIDLKVYFGPKHLVSDKNTLGILGGMGPLSDANLIELIVNQMLSSRPEGKKIGMLHLLSLPPPRTTLDQISGGPGYAMRLASFLRQDYASFFLASNTAHVYLDSLQLVAGSEKIINLPLAVVNKIANHPQLSNEPVLILGTSKTWENHLYDELFKHEGVSFKTLTAKDQSRIQEWIDRIKTSKLEKHHSHILYQEILLLARKYGTSNILLGCTELPLGLSDYAMTLYREGFLLFDTEKIFAEYIAKALSKN
jgi:aspartate racemase